MAIRAIVRFGAASLAAFVAACGPTIGEQLNRNIEERIEEARQAGKSQEEIRRLREKLEDEAAFAEAYIAVKLARTLR